MIDEAGAMVKAHCAAVGTFETALHGVARILKAELGAIQARVYRVRGTDETHARIAELAEAHPGFHPVERRVHVQRSTVGRAIRTQHVVIVAGGRVVLPVPGPTSVVAVIALTGLQLDIDARCADRAARTGQRTACLLGRTLGARWKVTGIRPAWVRMVNVELSARTCHRSGPCRLIPSVMLASWFVNRVLMTLKSLFCVVTSGSR